MLPKIAHTPGPAHGSSPRHRTCAAAKNSDSVKIANEAVSTSQSGPRILPQMAEPILKPFAAARVPSRRVNILINGVNIAEDV